MKNKYVKMIDLVLVVGSMIFLTFFVRYAQPLVISPTDDYVTTDGNVLFEFEKADLILIDDNPSFTSPEKIYAEDELVINLKPGVYYWKAEGALPSGIRKFTIQSEVELMIKEKNDGVFEIVNGGNTILNVDVYENEKFTERIVLDTGDSEESKGTKFIGGQNEN